MLIIGLMSGTSLDGVDGVLTEIGGDARLRVLGHAHLPMPEPLRSAFLALNHSGPDELHRAALAANADRKSTRLNSSHSQQSRMPSSA